jgi:hypothetical protein
VLHVEGVADPRPDAGEALVRLRAAALNHRDVWIQSTLSPASAGLGQAALPRRYVKVARMAIADNWNAAPVTAQLITANVTCGTSAIR